MLEILLKEFDTKVKFTPESVDLKRPLEINNTTLAVTAILAKVLLIFVVEKVLPVSFDL